MKVIFLLWSFFRQKETNFTLINKWYFQKITNEFTSLSNEVYLEYLIYEVENT